MNINAETLIQDAFDRATDTFKIIEKGGSEKPSFFCFLHSYKCAEMIIFAES